MMRGTTVGEMEAAGVATIQRDELLVYMELLKQAKAVVGAIERNVVEVVVEWVLPQS